MKADIEAAREFADRGRLVSNLRRLLDAAEKDIANNAAYGGMRYAAACGRAQALRDAIELARFQEASS